MALNQAFRLKLGISVGNGGAMNAKEHGQFAARGNAVAGPEVTGMNQGPQLIAKLNVEGDVAFGLKV